MLVGKCHCGAVSIQVPRKPRRLTDCNCSICRRYGTLWAYFRPAEVKLRSAPKATAWYSWGSRHLRFVRCRNCGVVTHWQAVRRQASPRIGINMRNFDPQALKSVRIRHLDGASTWKWLD